MTTQLQPNCNCCGSGPCQTYNLTTPIEWGAGASDWTITSSTITTTATSASITSTTTIKGGLLAVNIGFTNAFGAKITISINGASAFLYTSSSSGATDGSYGIGPNVFTGDVELEDGTGGIDLCIQAAGEVATMYPAYLPGGSPLSLAGSYSTEANTFTIAISQVSGTCTINGITAQDTVGASTEENPCGNCFCPCDFCADCTFPDFELVVGSIFSPGDHAPEEDFVACSDTICEEGAGTFDLTNNNSSYDYSCFATYGICYNRDPAVGEFASGDFWSYTIEPGSYDSNARLLCFICWNCAPLPDDIHSSCGGNCNAAQWYFYTEPLATPYDCADISDLTFYLYEPTSCMSGSGCGIIVGSGAIVSASAI